MKKLNVTLWLGILILTATMAVPAFAAQRKDCCVEKNESGNSQMRSEQESFPWENPGGGVKVRTEKSLSE